MTIHGHIRKKKPRSKKEVCIECECLSQNCLNHCSGTQVYPVYHSFRPPKRGSKQWKKIKQAVILSTHDPKTGERVSISAPVFGSHAFQNISLPQKIKDDAYLEMVIKTFVDKNRRMMNHSFSLRDNRFLR